MPSLPLKFAPYENDPVGFIQDILGCHLTPDQKVIAESVRDHRITLVESANAIGKGFVSARIALWALRCHIGAAVYTTAAPPEENLKNLVWGEIDDALSKCDQDLKKGMKRRVMSIEYAPRWALRGVTIPTTGTAKQREAKFSGKHAPYILFLVDEADGVPHEAWTGIESCLSGGTTRVLVLLNPRYPSGWSYDLRNHPNANVLCLSAFNHPNVVTGQNLFPGAVSREITVERIQMWSRPLQSDENAEPTRTFVVPDFLDKVTTKDKTGFERPPLKGGSVRVVMESTLDYMTLARYSALAGEQLIASGDVYRAIRNWREYVAEHGETPPVDVKPLLGYDVAEMDSDSNALVARYDKYIDSFHTWVGLDLEESGDRVKRYSEAYQGHQGIFVDAIGVGAGMPHQLRRKGIRNVTAVKVVEKPTTVARDDNNIVIGEFYQLRDQLWWQLREFLRQNDDVLLPDDLELVSELITPTFTYSKRGKIKVLEKDKIRKILNRSTNKADALALTFAEKRRSVLGLV